VENILTDLGGGRGSWIVYVFDAIVFRGSVVSVRTT
jgi:hypothetical protein